MNTENYATIDTLGRITAETYSDISDSQSLVSHTYDYTNYSNRMDQRDSTSYGFDTLGKLTSEGSMSYTSDILGNPTNAGEDNLIYYVDRENRITDVNDTSGNIATYDYDRLGRRRSKMVGETKTNFVYDISGNIIAEYEDNVWKRDYVYGANGEPVYMQMPRTTSMNTESNLFWDAMSGFADAWLCNPNCTTSQLVYDCNTPDDPNAVQDQVNLYDWPCVFDGIDLGLVFDSNGRYLLTDLRHSVIATADIDSITEISYDAWGIPSYTGSIDGLSILWNGYYYDTETDNYYLRNRYYSPLERRFLTEDPYGINPDETWNNPFLIKDQYSDGFGLKVYAQGDSVNKFDPWGLWYYAKPASERTKESRTFVVANGYWEMMHNIHGLAKLVGLDKNEFKAWGKRAIHKVNGVKKCGAWVPNTIPVLVSEMSWLQYQYNIMDVMKIYNMLEQSGFNVNYYDRYMSSSPTKDAIINMDKSDWWGLILFGHGDDSNGNFVLEGRNFGLWWPDVTMSPKDFKSDFKYAGLVGVFCFSGDKFEGRQGWSSIAFGKSFLAKGRYSAASGPRGLRPFFFTWRGLVNEMLE